MPRALGPADPRVSPGTSKAQASGGIGIIVVCSHSNNETKEEVPSQERFGRRQLLLSAEDRFFRCWQLTILRFRVGGMVLLLGGHMPIRKVF